MRKLMSLTSLLVLVALVITLASCGDDEGSSSGGRPTDNAFASEMIPHHEGAIEMAELAKARAEHPEIRRLARGITISQREEIAALRFAKRQFRKDDVPVGDLGLSEAHMAKEGDLDMLRAATDFDRSFIEMMIPHHRGAIDMAAVELRNGQDTRLKALARSIIDAQQREIKQMEAWFADWYGGEPAHESSAEHGG